MASCDCRIGILQASCSSSAVLFFLFFSFVSLFSFLFVCIVDGRAGSAGVSEQVQQGHAVVGFMVSAVPAHLIMQVADADLILPAKVVFTRSCLDLPCLWAMLNGTIFLFCPGNVFRPKAHEQSTFATLSVKKKKR